MTADPINTLRQRFVYRRDDGGDKWNILKAPTGKLYGDCEDFALTALWLMAGRSMTKFWMMQITGQACLWYCHGRGVGGHCMLWVKGHGWIDNWYPKFGERRHKRIFPYLPPMVLANMLLK